MAGSEQRAFSDCAQCPQMVNVPAGEFTMGSPASELYRGPEAQHRVKVPAFALGRIRGHVRRMGSLRRRWRLRRTSPDDQGWGKGKHPVIGVSWDDAKAYVAWLSRKTGKPYRLASEAEWEYAARAGTATTVFLWRHDHHGAGKLRWHHPLWWRSEGDNRQKTMPAGSFPANAFGVHDMHGNVWEWIEDCWSDEYTAANPSDGKPYVKANCGGHVMRGGSWEDYPGDIRAAARVGSGNDEQSWADGFRVARAPN
jgi:formylglycine-generating enzyme required for sulfatase activity